MSIKEGGKRASRKSLTGANVERYVVPESAIRDYVEQLGIFDIEPAATRFLAVADATRRILEQRIERLKPADVRLILRIATESKNKRYQQIMKAIVVSVGQGPDGIKAAHLTARRALEISFKWTRDYVLCFTAFEHRLRENRVVSEARESSTRESSFRLSSVSR
ncbi:MAG TPA: hypothetical protein VLM38_06600 [Blastocatellia bacterium]|nr:hypothetical protein [Blastocatellia bacterium]